jgi:hypothetical protein
MLRVLMDIALGNEEESRFYHNGFKEQEKN